MIFINKDDHCLVLRTMVTSICNHLLDFCFVLKYFLSICCPIVLLHVENFNRILDSWVVLANVYWFNLLLTVMMMTGRRQRN